METITLDNCDYLKQFAIGGLCNNCPCPMRHAAAHGPAVVVQYCTVDTVHDDCFTVAADWPTGPFYEAQLTLL